MTVEGNLLADEERKNKCNGSFLCMLRFRTIVDALAAVGGQGIAGEWEGSVFLSLLNLQTKLQYIT